MSTIQITNILLYLPKPKDEKQTHKKKVFGPKIRLKEGEYVVNVNGSREANPNEKKKK